MKAQMKANRDDGGEGVAHTLALTLRKIEGYQKVRMYCSVSEQPVFLVAINPKNPIDMS